MNINKILNKNWEYLFSRRMTYQKVRLYHYGFWKSFEDIFGVKQRYELYRLIKGDLFGYLLYEELGSLKKHLQEKFSNRRFISKTIKSLPDRIEKDFDNYLIFVKSIPKDLSNYSNKQLENVLNKYYKQEQIVSMGFWVLFVNVEEVLIESTEELLEKSGMAKDKIKELLNRLSQPIKIIPLDTEKLSLLKIAVLNKEKQESALKKHCQDFAYLPMYDINFDSYDLNYFKKKLNELNKSSTKNKIKDEIKSIKKKYTDRYNYYLKTTKKFKNKKEIYYMLKFFVAYGYLKDFKPYTRDKGSYHIKPVFKEIAERLGLTLEQTLFLNEEEIPKMLNGEILIKKEDLNKRMINSAYYCNRDKIHLIINKKELDKIDKVLNKKEEIKELKGTGVSPGFVRGKVSIILSNNDFKKFKQHEILVTGATRPDFVPLMKKARGIITDEGGILSHAAILSRELHKPCVVGTVKATRVLKDGDLVEVDANKGIVKIIKKQNKNCD